MIQELGELQLDPAFRDLAPMDNDRMIVVREHKILIHAEEDTMRLPTWAEVRRDNRDTGSPRYLFAIGEEHYFLAWNLEVTGYRYEAMTYLRHMYRGTGKQYCYAALVGLQLADWMETRQYCGRCGHKLEFSHKEQQLHCPSCGVMEYPKICPCVIVGVIHDGKILVSHYAGGFTNHYALIAGFAEFGETIEECVHREVMEETGLKVRNLKYYKCQPWPFSSSLLFGFFCELDGDEHIVLDETELAMAKFIRPEDVYEQWNDYALTNEMLCKFRDDYQKYGKLIL